MRILLNFEISRDTLVFEIQLLEFLDVDERERGRWVDSLTIDFLVDIFYFGVIYDWLEVLKDYFQG